mgnify:CR=1 FL=1
MWAFGVIRAWAVATLAGVSGYNKVYGTVRLISNDTELEADFGLGDPPEDERQQRTHGWMVMFTGITPDEIDTYTGLEGYGLEITCYSSVHGRGSSEATFDSHANAVRLALGADIRPVASIPNVYDVSIVVMELALVEFPRFGGRLHHRATLRLTVRVEKPLRS